MISNLQFFNLKIFGLKRLEIKKQEINSRPTLKNIAHVTRNIHFFEVPKVYNLTREKSIELAAKRVWGETSGILCLCFVFRLLKSTRRES